MTSGPGLKFVKADNSKMLYVIVKILICVLMLYVFWLFFVVVVFVEIPFCKRYNAVCDNAIFLLKFFFLKCIKTHQYTVI